MPKIVRLTLFKIGDDALLQAAKSKYTTLAQDAVKVSVESFGGPSKHPNPAMHPISRRNLHRMQDSNLVTFPVNEARRDDA
jgi:hypothetical protein